MAADPRRGAPGREAGASPQGHAPARSVPRPGMQAGPAREAGASPQGLMPVRPRPLDGVTVLTLEHAVAAPFATRQLADLGARVIKIERPGEGDFARRYDQRVKGQASYFVWINRSKESLTLDVKHPEAKVILDNLLAGADVMVQNLAPGAAARLGLSAAALRAKNPRLIVCDISGYGANGPYRIDGGSIARHLGARRTGGGLDRQDAAEFDWTKTDLAFAFVEAARMKRGLVAWVEREGVIEPGEDVTVRVWEQWI